MMKLMPEEDARPKSGKNGKGGDANRKVKPPNPE
jgi:hypothetical protein